MFVGERRFEIAGAGIGHGDRGLGTGIAEIEFAPSPDPVGRDALFLDGGATLLFEPVPGRRGRFGRVDRCRPFPDGVGLADAVRGEHAGQRRDHDLPDPELRGDGAGVLTAGPAETTEGVIPHIMPARDRDLFDRLGHVQVHDLEKPPRQVVAVQRIPAGRARGADLVQPLLDPVTIEREREIPRHQPAEIEIDIGHGQVGRVGVPVTERAGIGAGTFRANRQSPADHPADRPAAGGHGMDRDHRRLDPHAGGDRFVHPFERPGIPRHIG